MALGLGSKADQVDSDSTHNNPSPEPEKQPVNVLDPESLRIGGKPMKRIDGALKRRTSISGQGDDSSADFSIGKQIEMEAGNAIQYRTCSWPKVRLLPYVSSGDHVVQPF